MTSDAPADDRILILDFGSQVTQLIARRVREQGVYCEIRPFNVDRDAHPRVRAAGRSSCRAARPRVTRAPARRARRQIVFELGVPVLGICYGQQTMCAQLGGEVEPATTASSAAPSSRSPATARCSTGCGDRATREQVWMSHGDRVTRCRRASGSSATSEGAPFAAIADDARRYYGVHVPPRGRAHAAGRQAARQFRAPRRGLPRRLDDGGLPRRRRSPGSARQVGKGRVICGLSGGVDSAVAAVLMHEAIGDQLTCIFVDHGLLRAGEAEQVVDAVPRPLQHPAGPSRRRRPVPRRARRRRPTPRRSARSSAACSSTSSRRRRKKLGGADFLAQGTLYPDVIESVSVHRRPQRHHQVAPQCRRPAGAHAA